MKGQRFHRRLGFAFNGLRIVHRSEASFRAQVVLAGFATLALVAMRPNAMWVALVALAAAFVLVAEALNAAVEYLADALHPAHHPLVGAAKDAAAGAVLIASLTAVVVALAAVYSCFS